MTEGVREIVVFRCPRFNATEPHDYFINPDCYGDDLAAWLGSSLRSQGATVSDPAQEDWGWYLDVTLHDAAFILRMGRYLDDDGATQWMVILQRDVGFLKGLFGADKAPSLELAQAVHSILADADDVAEVAWHYDRDFKKGDESRSSATPAAA